jgi:hypothetical protein
MISDDLSQHGDIITMPWHMNIVNVLLFNKEIQQLTEGWSTSTGHDTMRGNSEGA